MRRSLQEIQEDAGAIAWFVRTRRKQSGLTQEDFAEATGVGVRFLKELELGKPTLRLDKICQVLQYFGYGLVPAPLPEDRR